MNTTETRNRKRGKRDRRGGSTLKVLLLMAALLVPTVTGFTGAALTFTQRMLTDDGPDCAVLRVIDGSTLRLHCRDGGLVRARLIGIDPPQIFSPACIGELVDGYQARWAFQVLVWQARAVSLAFDTPAPDGTRRVRMHLDGADVAKTLVYRRHSRQDAFGRVIDRCSHIFGAPG